MNVLNPFFLWLLPLAGLPVLFHLFFKVRRRARVFSSLMFLRKADPRLTARKRLRELLVLLLRVLALLLLLLALARPVWLGKGGGGSVAEVLLVDNSASMNAPGPGGKTKLDLALEAAGALISDLREEDSAAVALVVEDPAAAVPAGLTSDKARLHSALDRTMETEAFGSPARALADAFELLESGSAARLEVHIFTDAQENEWSKKLSNRPPPSGTVVTVHRIPSEVEKEANISVSGLELQRRRLLAGRSARVDITLSNPSSLDGKARLNILGDAGEKTTREITVPRHESRTVPFEVDQGSPGSHWLKIWLEEDGFSSDNRAYVGFSCAARELVVFPGPRESYGLLPLALSPSGDGAMSGLAPLFVQTATLEQTLSEKKPVMVVATWSTAVSSSSGRRTDDILKEFVDEGGVLLLVPSAKQGRSAGQVPSWIGAAPAEETGPGLPAANGQGGEAGDKSGLPLVLFDEGSPVWDDLRDEKGEILIKGIKVFRFMPLTPAADAVPLLGLEDGRSLLCERSFGKGTVFSSGLAFETRWSTMPLKGGFLAIVQSMALAQPVTRKTVSLVAGERLARIEGLNDSIHIEPVTGSPLDWRGGVDELPVFARAGVYTVRSDENLIHVAVRASAGEGRARFVKDPSIPCLDGITHKVSLYTDPEACVEYVHKARTGIDMFMPLLLLVLLAVMTEGWIVNPVPRKSRMSG